MKKILIKKLPLISIVVAMFLAIGLILFVGIYSKKEAFSNINIWGARETIIDPENKDSDGDGLKDWEEDLYKTDIYNPDTDGDGFLDGEEINSGHNPTVKGPGDKIAFYPLPLGEKYNITKKVLTEEQLANVLKSYIIQKDQYLQDHPEITSPEEFLSRTEKATVQEIGRRAIYDNYENLSVNAEAVLFELPEIFNVEITDQDIRISEDNSKEAIENYLLKASSFINVENFFFREQTMQALNRALGTRSFSEIQEIIKNNDAKIERLKQLLVPSSWKEIHKQGLKAIILTRNIFVSFRDLENDPLKAMAGAERLEPLFKYWTEVMNNVVRLAQSQNIELNF